jgi:hypothetical protein
MDVPRLSTMLFEVLSKMLYTAGSTQLSATICEIRQSQAVLIVCKCGILQLTTQRGENTEAVQAPLQQKECSTVQYTLLQRAASEEGVRHAVQLGAPHQISMRWSVSCQTLKGPSYVMTPAATAYCPAPLSEAPPSAALPQLPHFQISSAADITLQVDNAALTPIALP